MTFGTPEIVVVFVLFLLIFGSRFLPRLARSIGDAKRQLKDPDPD